LVVNRMAIGPVERRCRRRLLGEVLALHGSAVLGPLGDALPGRTDWLSATGERDPAGGFAVLEDIVRVW